MQYMLAPPGLCDSPKGRQVLTYTRIIPHTAMGEQFTLLEMKIDSYQ